MAAKISTLVLTVDLSCPKCYKKIKKVLSKFCEIQSQSFDEKNNKVIISGPFDPEKLKKKICCKACKYIKAIEIKKPDIPKPPPPAPKPDPPKPAPEPPKPAPEPPKPAPEPPKPAPEPPKPAPEPPKPAPPPPKPASPPPQPAPPPPPVHGVPLGPYGPYGPYWICGPRVCCGECYEGREDGICRRRGGGPRVCCSECYEGREDGICRRRGYESGGPRVCCSECYEGREDGICRRRGYESGCHFFSEEDPSSCIIM